MFYFLFFFYFNFKKYRKYLQSFVDWFVFRCFMSISYMCVSVRWKSIRNPVSYNGMVDNKMSRNGIYLSHDKLFVLFDRLMEKGIIKRTTEKSSSKPATAVSSVATRFFFFLPHPQLPIRIRINTAFVENVIK